jgi:membrane protease YdiL (CAAX protease family)
MSDMQDRKKSESINSWLQVIIFLAVYLLCFLALGFLLPSTSAGGLANSLYLPIAAASILSIVLVFVFTKLVFKKDLTSPGLNYKDQGRRALSGACLGVFLITSGSLILYAGNWLEWGSTDADFSDIILLSGLLLLSAFSEELVFRGFILGRLLNTTNRVVALLVSSAVFALFHMNNPEVSVVAVVNIFLGGILLGITYTYNRNIWFGFMLHFTWNLCQGPVLGIPVSGLVLPSLISSQIQGPELISGGQFGLEASLVEGALLIACSIVLWRLNAAEINRPLLLKRFNTF